MIRQREPADCQHRCETDSAMACTLIAEIVDLPNAECAVADDACQACCHFPVPAVDAWNPVIGSLISRLTADLLESGHPRLTSRQLSEIQLRARGNLRGNSRTDPATYFETRDQTGCCYLGDSQNGVDYECGHADHDSTTLDHCRWCRDWSEHQESSGCRDLSDIVTPPHDRCDSKVHNWCVGITTAPRDQPTLGLSTDSLIRAGWTDPIIFADGAIDIPERFDQLQVVRRSRQLGAWPNFLLGLQELLFAEPDADAYLVVQDDAVFCDGVDVKKYLEQHVLWPGSTPSIVSLYCPEPYTTEPDTWHTLDEVWVWGALAFVFPRDIARQIVMDEKIHQHRWDKDRNGKALIDVIIGEWARRNDVPIHYPVPSLVQHVGHVSTVFTGNHVLGPRRASRFAGDEMRSESRLSD